MLSSPCKPETAAVEPHQPAASWMGHGGGCSSAAPLPFCSSSCRLLGVVLLEKSQERCFTQTGSSVVTAELRLGVFRIQMGFVFQNGCVCWWQREFDMGGFDCSVPVWETCSSLWVSLWDNVIFTDHKNNLMVIRVLILLLMVFCHEALCISWSKQRGR